MPTSQAHSPLTRSKCPASYTYDASPYHYDTSDLTPTKQGLRHPIREQFEPLASPAYTYHETQNSLAQKEDPTNGDGHLTLTEANEHYRNGNGQPVQVDTSKLKFDGINTAAFDGIGSRVGYTFTPGTTDFLVHGSIVLELVGPNTVIIVGDRTTGYDNGGWYDFEMHDWGDRPLRNLETIGASAIAGNGERYPILYNGTGTISDLKIPTNINVK